MKLIQGLSCFAVAASIAAPLHAKPRPLQFQPLTPGATSSQSSWVNHLNQMSEVERQERVRTYGMPPAPPNRWLRPKAVPQPTTSQPAPVRPTTVRPTTVRPIVRSAASATPATVPKSRSTSARRAAPPSPPKIYPKSLYQNASQRPQPTKVKPTTTLSNRGAVTAPSSTSSSLKPATAPPSIAEVTQQASGFASTKKKAKATPQKFKRLLPSAVPQKKTKIVRTKKKLSPPVLPKFTFPGFRKKRTAPAENPPVQPIMFKAKPTPPKPDKLQEKEATLRRRLAFMPKRPSGRSSNPWAPYQSRAEYMRAVANMEWKPRGPVVEKLKKTPAPKPKRRFSLTSIFKRRSSGNDAPRGSRSSKKHPTSVKIPDSRYVTSGMPQADRGSAPMIETTLFGR